MAGLGGVGCIQRVVSENFCVVRMRKMKGDALMTLREFFWVREHYAAGGISPAKPAEIHQEKKPALRNGHESDQQA